jgi:hypothetical protein
MEKPLSQCDRRGASSNCPGTSRVSQRDWDPLVTDNPFIPPGRERIFAEGLHAGLMGNLLVAVHLLVPQFENSIREILTRAGAITSKLNK